MALCGMGLRRTIRRLRSASVFFLSGLFELFEPLERWRCSLFVHCFSKFSSHEFECRARSCENWDSNIFKFSLLLGLSIFEGNILLKYFF